MILNYIVQVHLCNLPGDGFINKNKVKVNNPNGKFTSNNIVDFFEVSKKKGYEVISDNLNSNELWMDTSSVFC